MKYEAAMKNFQSRRVPPKKPLSPYLEFSKEEISRVIADLGPYPLERLGRSWGEGGKNFLRSRRKGFSRLERKRWKIM